MCGNFRLFERLFPQTTRVLKINQPETITNDGIEAAAHPFRRILSD